MCSRLGGLERLLIACLSILALHCVFFSSSFRPSPPSSPSLSLSRYREALDALGDYAFALRAVSEGGATWDLVEELAQRKEAVQVALDRAATELGDLREHFK